MKRKEAFRKWYDEEGIHRFPGGELTLEEWEWIAEDVFEDAYIEGWKSAIVDKT